MWKIIFRYSDGGVITVRGKGKDIPLHLAQKYYRDYGVNQTEGCIRNHLTRITSPNT